MKKLFFFRSSVPSSENKNPSPPSLKDKELYWEPPSENGLNGSSKGLFSKSRKHSSEHQSPLSNSALRRSRSLSSAAFQANGLDQMNFTCSSDRSRSPSIISSTPTRKQSRSSRRAVTPDRKSETKRFGPEAIDAAYRSERLRSSIAQASFQDLSGNSLLCSSSISSKVVDRYIDGEQHERGKSGTDCSQRSQAGQGQEKSRRPPRAQYGVPDSPAGNFNDKPKSHSFRDARGAQHDFSTGDWVENGYGFESPRRLAKNVIQKLSQCSSVQNTSPKDFSTSPITVEDLYVGSLKRPSSQNGTGFGQNISLLDRLCEAPNAYDEEGLSSTHKKKSYVADNVGDSNSVVNGDAIDAALQNSLKEANERAMFLSQEFEQQKFLCDSGFDVPALVHKIKNLVEEKMSLAFEVSSILQSCIADRANSKEELRQLTSELCNRTQRLERERNEIQACLEKELDRRSSDWSIKLEKYRSEEHRLRERVRELAEQNVAMQREILSLNEKEIDNRHTMTHSEQQLKDQMARLEETRKQNQDLMGNLTQLQQQCRAIEEDRDCFRKNYEEKESECKDLHKSVTRLMRTNSDQEKTIGELRDSLVDKIEGKLFSENFDKHAKIMLVEQIRTTGVEQALRREVDSYRLEAESLRHENIELINHLKGVGKEGLSFTFKLDQEMRARIGCLQNQGLALLNESTQLCSQLHEFVKRNTELNSAAQQGVDKIRNGLDGQLMMECDVKIQGFKRGIESLTRSLQTLSLYLQEKSNLTALDDDPQSRTEPTSEKILKSELMAEKLLTNLLLEKLHCNKLELEQLQAELASAVRGNDILKCEVQDAMDSLSCTNHKLKEFELQIRKKDDNINRIQNDLQESTKELTMIKGILSKVSDERDLMWEEVKQYSEKYMLLNSENNALKKKIETLDEDVLVKDGQISILKDSIYKKPFDLLGSPNSGRTFLLD